MREVFQGPVYAGCEKAAFLGLGTQAELSEVTGAQGWDRGT
jgi:hypothetical protein